MGPTEGPRADCGKILIKEWAPVCMGHAALLATPCLGGALAVAPEHGGSLFFMAMNCGALVRSVLFFRRVLPAGTFASAKHLRRVSVGLLIFALGVLGLSGFWGMPVAVSQGLSAVLRGWAGAPLVMACYEGFFYLYHRRGRAAAIRSVLLSMALYEALSYVSGILAVTPLALLAVSGCYAVVAGICIESIAIVTKGSAQRLTTSADRVRPYVLTLYVTATFASLGITWALGVGESTALMDGGSTDYASVAGPALSLLCLLGSIAVGRSSRVLVTWCSVASSDTF